ncbi:MAG: hypothetical protein ACRDOM_00045 [Nocardioides sp.]
MKRSLLASLLGALLVMGAASTAAVVLVSSADEPRTPASSAEPGKHAEKAQAKPKDEKSRGLGPPPWAQAHKSKESREQRADWKAAWQALTPAQREARMRTLARAHANGMEKWGDCVAAAGADKAKRAACEKPLPPGQAKRRS